MTHRSTPRIRDGYPIGLRLVPFVCRWTARQTIRLLTEEFLNDHPIPLRIFEYFKKRTPGRVDVDRLQTILAGPLESEEEVLRAIPPSFFVWSNELRDAYRLFRYGVEQQPGDYPVEPNWEPSTHPFGHLVDECPDFGGMLRAKRARDWRRSEKAQIIREWRSVSNEMLRKNRHLSYSDVAREIIKQGKSEGYSIRSIRRALSDG